MTHRTPSPFAAAPTRRGVLRLAGLGGAAAALGGIPLDGGGAAAAEPIRRREIPSSGEPLPVVGLGTWQQFDVAEDSDELPQLTEVLRTLFEGGGTVIDSSPMYGRSEARVGQLLGRVDATDKPFLATKVWIRGKRDGAEQMRRSAELMAGGGTIDLMQVHNLLDTDIHIETMADLKRAGRIRYLGVTHYTASALDDLMDAIERHDVDFVQFAYSVAEREPEERMLPFCRERGVATLINRPYDKGGLFRAVKGRELPAWAGEFADSWGQFFLKYLLAEPAVTCVIPGTSKPTHMADNLGAGRGRLPDAAEREKMRALVAEL